MSERVNQSVIDWGESLEEPRRGGAGGLPLARPRLPPFFRFLFSLFLTRICPFGCSHSNSLRQAAVRGPLAAQALTPFAAPLLLVGALGLTAGALGVAGKYSLSF